MLRMNQIDEIKDLQNQGYGSREIARRLRLDRKTVSKYMDREDYSCFLAADPPASPSKLDRWKTTIDLWLEEDRKMRFKQRHTAKRVHERLVQEYPGEFACSYTLVQRYVKAHRFRKRDGAGFMDLVWAGDEAQADFGEADILEAGSRRTVKYLVLSFPSSNAAYLQAFGGETAECVTEGLKAVFHHIGGVPSRIVFDNASGVGRRVRERVSLNELFLRFKCHYGFSVSFCNPYSGHEKGNVENKVGYLRRNYFVPIPEIEDLESWNCRLLEQAECDFNRPHYKKSRSIAELFAEDREKLGPLPSKPFNVERYEQVRTDGYGKFCLDSRHWYASSPDLARKDLVVGIGAHSIRVYDRDGSLCATHRRIFGDERSDTANYQTSLELLVRKPGAWMNSNIRGTFDEAERKLLDELSKDERKRILSVMVTTTGSYGFDVAMASLHEAIRRQALDSYSVQTIADRAAYDGIGGTSGTGLDLRHYDATLIDTRRVTP